MSMITYELALALKQAGFPQNNGHYCPQEGCGWDACSPSLSELIDACGKVDITIWKERRESGDVWYAGIYYIHTSDSENLVYNDEFQLQIPWSKRKTGSIPEEAVAKLWLALNKKVVN